MILPIIDDRMIHINDVLPGRIGLGYEPPGDAGFGLGQFVLTLAGLYGAHGRMPRESQGNRD